MDTQVDKCTDMDTPVEKCIEKVEEFEGISCNEMDTQIEKCIESRADRLLFPPPPPTKVTVAVFTIEKFATYH